MGLRLLPRPARRVACTSAATGLTEGQEHTMGAQPSAAADGSA